MIHHNTNNPSSPSSLSSENNQSDIFDDTDTEDMDNSLCEHEIKYLHEDRLLPVLDEKSETFSVEEVFYILTTAIEKYPNYICEAAPYNVSKSSSFLVDLSKLDNVNDIKVNDSSAMTHHGQKLCQIITEVIIDTFD